MCSIVSVTAAHNNSLETTLVNVVFFVQPPHDFCLASSYTLHGARLSSIGSTRLFPTVSYHPKSIGGIRVWYAYFYGSAVKVREEGNR
jgi:hypothetical protein